MKDHSMSRLVLLPVSATIAFSCALYLTPSAFATDIEGTIDSVVGLTPGSSSNSASGSTESGSSASNGSSSASGSSASDSGSGDSSATTTRSSSGSSSYSSGTTTDSTTQDVSAGIAADQSTDASATVGSSQSASQQGGSTTLLGTVLGFIVPDPSVRAALEEGIGASLPWCVIILFAWSVIATVGWGTSQRRLRAGGHFGLTGSDADGVDVMVFAETAAGLDHVGRHDTPVAHGAHPVGPLAVADDSVTERLDREDVVVESAAAEVDVPIVADEDVVSRDINAPAPPTTTASLAGLQARTSQQMSRVPVTGPTGLKPDFSAAFAIPVPLIAEAGFKPFASSGDLETHRTATNPLLRSQSLLSALPNIEEPAPEFEQEPAATGAVATMGSRALTSPLDETPEAPADWSRPDVTIASPQLPIMSPDLARLLAEAHTSGKVVDLPVRRNHRGHTGSLSPVDGGTRTMGDAAGYASDTSLGNLTALAAERPLVLRPVEEVTFESTHAVGETYSSHVVLDRLIAQLEADSERMRMMPAL